MYMTPDGIPGYLVCTSRQLLPMGVPGGGDGGGGDGGGAGGEGG